MPSPAEDTPEAQQVLAPLSTTSIFLVVKMKSGAAADAAMRAMGDDLGALIRSVGFRDIESKLSCIMGIGPEAWDRIVAPTNPTNRPAGLHPFIELRGAKHHAPSTPGDLLFHIRAGRFDLCFELATQILAKLGPEVESVDEVDGFRYFDARDLLGFVDGTENPVGSAVAKAAVIGDEDSDFAGGSYVIVQKYLHDIDAWNALSTEQQELAIGRTKLADIELTDDVKPSNAHNALNVIEVDGEEIQILRDNMPFGSPASGEFGTYFIGYARAPWVTEQMLRNMFIGKPEGNYDRILDFSTAVTGTLFFVPSVDLLESLADIGPDMVPSATPAPAAPPSAPANPAASPTSPAGGSLNIGGLR